MNQRAAIIDTIFLSRVSELGGGGVIFSRKIMEQPTIIYILILYCDHKNPSENKNYVISAFICIL